MMKKLFLVAVFVTAVVGNIFSQEHLTKGYIDSLIAVTIEASGTITGNLKEVFNSSATVALTADSCRNIVHTNADADAIEFDLPAGAYGLCTGFLDGAGGAMTLDPNGSEYIVVNGVSAGAGTSVVSDGTRGRYIVLLGRPGYWEALPSSGWE